MYIYIKVLTLYYNTLKKAYENHYNFNLVITCLKKNMQRTHGLVKGHLRYL